MVYRFSDTEWEIVKTCYAKNCHRFSSITRLYMQNIINQAEPTHEITTPEQADAIITLLLAAYTANTPKDGEEEEKKEHIKSKNDIQTDDNRINMMDDILESIRLFVTNSNQEQLCLNNKNSERSRKTHDAD